MIIFEIPWNVKVFCELINFDLLIRCLWSLWSNIEENSNQIIY